MSRKSSLTAGGVALVTGAASGIGKAACKRLAESGLSVCLVDLHGKRLERAVGEIAGSACGKQGLVQGFPADLSDAGQIERLREEIVARFGRVTLSDEQPGHAGLMNNPVTRV